MLVPVIKAHRTGSCVRFVDKAILPVSDREAAGGRGMKRIGLVIASVAFVFASAANAQSVSGRVTGTVGEAVAGAGQAGAGLSGSQAPSSSNSSNSSLLGGELPAGVK